MAILQFEYKFVSVSLHKSRSAVCNFAGRNTVVLAAQANVLKALLHVQWKRMH